MSAIALPARRFWPLLLLLLALLCYPCEALIGLAWAGSSEPVQTMPQQNSSFLSALQQFLRQELASVVTKQSLTNYVSSGGVHSTSGTCTASAISLDAVTSSGNHVSADGAGGTVAIDYSAATIAANCSNPGSDVCYVVASTAGQSFTATNSRTVVSMPTLPASAFNRAGTSNLYVDCTSSAKPALPSDSVDLMKVTITNGAITAVQDFRQPVSFARSRVYDVTDPLYGAVGNGTTDDTTAITTALAAAGYRAGSIGGSDALTTTPLTGGAIVYVPPGTYKMTAQTNIPLRVTLKGAGYASVLKKVMNGYLLSMSSWTRLEDLAIDGQGASSVGAGVLISEGTNVEHRGRQMIRRVAIYDTESYNIEYAGAGVGYGSSITECDFDVHGHVVPAIKMPSDGANPGNRHVLNNRNINGDLADFGGCQNCTFIGNLSGNTGGAVATAGGIIFSGGLAGKKGIFVGNRFATTDATTVEGVDHVFAANVFASSVTLGTTTNNVRFDYSNVVVPAGATTVQDNGASVNNLVFKETLDWTPTWTGLVANPALGNGTLRGRYHTNGKRTYVEIYLSMGSTTTFGSGDWVFGLPGTASDAANGVVYVGTVWMRDASAAADYVGAAYAVNGGTAITVIGYNTAHASATVPFTWAMGDEIFISLSFDR